MDAIKTAKVWIGERKGITSPIHVSQYDTVWTFQFKVYKDGLVYEPENAVSVVMEGLKADGTTFAVPGTFADGVATIVSTVAMTAAAGIVECELRISEGGETVGTGNFDLVVEASPIEGGTPSEDDYTTLQTMVDAVAQSAVRAEAAASIAAMEVLSDVPEIVLDWLEGNITQETGYVIDASLTVAGAAADAKAIGDKIADLAEGMPAEIGEVVEAWLDDHPEATTTVQDGSLTEGKFAEELKLKAIKDYVTPEMYGAVGDGSTDDTAAFQDMLAANKKIYLGGAYRLTASLNLASDTHIFGNGTIFDRRIGSLAGYAGLLQATAKDNIVIEGITIETSDSSSTIDYKCELYFVNCTGTRVKNLTINNADGLYGILCNRCNDTQISYCTIDGYKFGGIANINEGNDFVVDHCRILNCDADRENAYSVMLNGYDTTLSSDTYGGRNLQVTNCYFYSADPHWECVDAHGGTDILIAGNVFRNAPCAISAFTDAERHFFIKGVNISNNFLEGSADHLNNICVVSGENLVVANNIIKNGGNSSASTQALRITNASNGHIHHNSIYNSLDKGINISQATNVIVSSNVIDTVVKTNDPNSYGIYCANGAYVDLIIENNIIKGAEIGIRYPNTFTNSAPYVRGRNNQFDPAISIPESNIKSGTVPQFAQGVTTLQRAKKGDIVYQVYPSATASKGWFYTGSQWLPLESYVPVYDLSSGADHASVFAAGWEDLPVGISRIKYVISGSTYWGHAYKTTDNYGLVMAFGYVSPYVFNYKLINGTWSQV